METKRITTATVALLIAASVHAPLAGAGDVGSGPSWPEFHGPGRTNMSPDRGLLKEWPEGGPKLLWTYSECGKGFSGVTIAQGMIFTAGYLGREEMLLALDMDGKLLWKSPNGAAWRGPSAGSRATPTYSDGAVYHMSAAGRLAAYGARAGDELWAVDLKSRFDAKNGIWAFAENVIVDGDKILCMPGGPKGRVVALNRRTGKTLWANTAIEHSAAYCSGVVLNYAGVRQLLTMTQKSVVAVNVENGTLVWSAPFVPTSPQNALTPVFRDGQVFVACGHSSGGTLMKIDPSSRTASTVWHREDLDNCHGGALLVGDKLYGCACRQGGKHVYCVDFLTGETIKLDKTLGKVGITYADGMIYAMNHQGTMFLLAVTDDGFDIVSRFELTRKGANFYLAHPVVCGGRLYLRGGPDLYVYNVRAN
jgi:outer membrane protein assembly factor BamB